MKTSTAAGWVPVETKGTVAASDVAYARTRFEGLSRYARDPVLSARARLTHLNDRALARPAVVEVNIDLNGRLVRAQVARPTMHEAIDEARNRLRDRLQRAAGDWEAIRGGRPSHEVHEWRHDSQPTDRPPYFPRPAEERQVIRHKAFSLARTTADDAAEEMSLLDFNFLLFTEAGSGVDSLLYRTDDGSRYRLAQVTPAPGRVRRGDLPVTISEQPAPHLTLQEATDRLNVSGWPFVFFQDATTHRGCVLYHRYDGHYGLITPVE
ncbi:MAG TPA: sigma 54 modulation/S30EA ribosomal C-terminal domain-containing protein [Mycobacteriales bacterium]|jgi:ribosome-associated translation inhibitor RaiA|nr:sigma 54 modulation/S30EA ribosomal C-terminal domain-containing protein [Mycobacteriales bacterium]